MRLIGEVATKSIHDDNVLPVLHRLKHPTFFTKDKDFWSMGLAHRSYCLVQLDIPEHEGQIAAYIRRFLKHPMFDIHSKRMGRVVRVHKRGISYWQVGQTGLKGVPWSAKT